MTGVSALNRLLAAGRCLEDALLVASLATMAVAAVAQIVLRNLLQVALPGAEPLVRLMVLWGGFLGAMVAARDNRHLRIEFLVRFCPAAWRPWLESAAAAAAGIVCLWLAGLAARFVLDEYRYGGAAFAGLAAWQAQLIMPAAFAVMAARFFLQARRSLLSRRAEPAP